jgi:hypothetical protein
MVGMTGDYDDRHRSEVRQQRQTRFRREAWRHHQIEQHHVGPRFLKTPQSAFAIACDGDAMPEAL